MDFQDQVLPVLQENCLPCHDRHTRTSGFSVESLDSVLAGGARHGAAVMPGAPDKSPLIKVLRGGIEPRMPLGRAFSEDRIQLIEQWIGGLSATPRTNSPAEPYWAYVKPAAGPPPEAKDSPWIRNGIDFLHFETPAGGGTLARAPRLPQDPDPQVVLRPFGGAARAGRGGGICR